MIYGVWGDMTVRQQNRWRSFFATLCLVAVVFLYAPFGAAAWALYSSACCTSGAQCPIHGHHHAQTPASPQHAIDCGHEMPGMAQCTMSCCHNPDWPAVASSIFVLPAPFTVSEADAFEPLIPDFAPQNPSPSFEPLSPPPRFCPLAA